MTTVHFSLQYSTGDWFAELQSNSCVRSFPICRALSSVCVIFLIILIVNTESLSSSWLKFKNQRDKNEIAEIPELSLNLFHFLI